MGTDSHYHDMSEEIRAAQEALYRAYQKAREEIARGELSGPIQNGFKVTLTQMPVTYRPARASAGLIDVLTAPAKAGVDMAIGVQRANLAASRSLLTSAFDVQCSLWDEAAESFRWGHFATRRLVASGFNFIDAILP